MAYLSCDQQATRQELRFEHLSSHPSICSHLPKQSQSKLSALIEAVAGYDKLMDEYVNLPHFQICRVPVVSGKTLPVPMKS